MESEHLLRAAIQVRASHVKRRSDSAMLEISPGDLRRRGDRSARKAGILMMI